MTDRTFLPLTGEPRPPRKRRVPRTGSGRGPGSGRGLSPAARRPLAPLVRASDSQPPVLIDERAGSRELVRHTPLDTCGQLCRLESADAYIVGVDEQGTPSVNVGVEVKSASDLIQSLETGRLTAEQIPAMFAAYDVSWLLVYGRFRANRYGALETVDEHTGTWRVKMMGARTVPYGYVASRLLTFTAVGLNVATVSDQADAAQWLAALARWWGKPLADHRTFKTFNRTVDTGIAARMREQAAGAIRHVDPRMRRCAEVAARLPCIGYDRAVAVAEHFKGSVRMMVSADEKEWMSVPGIGKGIASAVIEAVK